MPNYLNIIINGQRYTNYTKFNLKRAMDLGAGAFSLTFPIGKPAQAMVLPSASWPFRVGDQIKIEMGDTPVLTGYIESMDVDEANRVIKYQGRDNICDLIDSSIDNISLGAPATLIQIIKKVLAALGINITVIDLTEGASATVVNNQPGQGDNGGRTPQEQALVDAGIKAAIRDGTRELLQDQTTAASPIDAGISKIGQNVWEFLQQYAKKAKCVISSDGAGNLILQRIGSNRLNTKLQQFINENDIKGNIMEVRFKYDETKLFHKYIVLAQQNPAYTDGTGDTDSIIEQRGEAIDPLIRQSRTTVTNPDTSNSQKSANELAIWARNTARAQALRYSAKVAGFFADALPGRVGTELWLPNSLVAVYDEIVGLDDTLLIRAAEYNYNSDEGSTVTIELTYPDAFVLENRDFNINGVGNFLNVPDQPQSEFTEVN